MLASKNIIRTRVRGTNLSFDSFISFLYGPQWLEIDMCFGVI